MQEQLLPLVAEALGRDGILYKVFPCDTELADTAAFCERYGFTSDQSANTIIVVGKAEPVRYACCVVLASTRLDVNKMVRHLLGTKRVSFASMEDALRLTHMEYGGVTVFGLPADMPIYIDSRVLDCREVVMGGGNRTSKVVLDPQELLKLPEKHIVEGLAKPKSE